MPLIVSAGYATLTGQRECNEDFVGMVTPVEPDLSSKGVIAAIADGVSGNQGGRQASEYTVRGLLSDYYATPDTWSVSQALDRVLQAINNWVQQQGSIRREYAGMASTLTCIVLRGRFYHFAHVGDTRLYLWRGGVLTRLTTDHVWDRPEMRHVLTRAVGLDTRLAIDHGMGELCERDIFLLLSDGVWASLSKYELCSHLADFMIGRIDGDKTAEALIRSALAAGARDNVSAQVLKIDQLPAENLREAVSASEQLPVPPHLTPGQKIDSLTVEALIHASASTLLYRVKDEKTQRQLVLKTLHPDCAADGDERAAFAHEEWLAKRAVARFFPQVVNMEQKTSLYYLTTWHAGHTLQQRLDAGEHFPVPEVTAYAIKLVRAVGALHRRSIIHRDIKPGNIHLGDDGELRLLDFGVAQSGLDADDGNAAPFVGTPSFLAPEQFNHVAPSRQTDVYAVGVTLYYALTRHYPYGEIAPFQKPRFGEPIPPSRYRPNLPFWLENVLLKAIARVPSDRFDTAEEFLLALERGATRPLSAPAASPLLKRDPVSLWRAVAVFSIVLNLLMLYLSVRR